MEGPHNAVAGHRSSAEPSNTHEEDSPEDGDGNELVAFVEQALSLIGRTVLFSVIAEGKFSHVVKAFSIV